MNNKPLVSIFIPYYNDQKFLKDSIKSVIAQTYQNWELILLNHASTDSSKEIAHSFKDERIKHVDRDYNIGAGGGLLFIDFVNNAKGKYLKPFCADDILLPNAIEQMVSFMENNPNVDFAFSNMEYINENKKSLKENWFNYRKHFDKKNNELQTLKIHFDGIGHLPYPASIIKKDKIKISNIEKITYLVFDMTLWTNLLIDGSKIGFIDKILVHYRIHLNQISSSQKEANLTENAVGFEFMEFCNLFFRITNIEIIKYLCTNSKFSRILNESDKEFIDFVLAHHFINSSKTAYAIFGRYKMYEILEQDEKREKIRQRFGYTLADFRNEYKTVHLIDLSVKNQRVNPKEIPILKLIHLLARKILYIIIFKKEKKKLSL